MDIFQRDGLQMDYSEFDMFKRLRISTILKHLTGFAGIHYIDLGITYDFLLSKGLVFLISKASVEILQQIQQYENLLICTYEDGVHGANFKRNFVIYREDGSKAIIAKTNWILCNPNTRRILRPQVFSEIRKVAEHPDVKLACAEPGKILMPKDMKLAGTTDILYSYIDENGHLYNAKYGDIACDHVPLTLMEEGIGAFQINFLNEAVCGDTMEIYYKYDNGTYFIHGIVDGKSSFHMCLNSWDHRKNKSEKSDISK